MLMKIKFDSNEQEKYNIVSWQLKNTKKTANNKTMISFRFGELLHSPIDCDAPPSS